jgi:glycerophosphoryl diester phosphodiesterase
LNSRRFKPDYVDTAAKHKAQYLMLKYDDVTLADVKAIKAAGIRVLSSTANDPKDWPVYVRMGFEGVLTDAPGALMEFLKSGR